MDKSNHYDHLTGLPSMHAFFELAESEKQEIREKGGAPVLLYIDLNSMKFFNHKYGFEEGNRLLNSLAKTLVHHFGSHSCSRLGSDHFAILTKQEGLEEKLEELFRDCKKINEGKNLPVRVGIYSYEIEEAEINTACDRAKLACDTLRNTYVSCYYYFDSSLERQAEKHQYIIENLDQALKEHWIKVYYQPIIRATNGKICEEEALSRWFDPTYGLLSPADFIPALEETGLIYKLDLYVVEEVIEKIRFQKEHGMSVVGHSINLSRSDFDSCDIVEEIRRRVDESGYSRSLFKIELTESMVGSDFDFMKEQIARFRELGFDVWMDDFGNGYSTLNLLQSLELDLIKFDMQFMQSFKQGDSGKIILTELMKLAIGLNIDTICEGVETEEEAQFLREIGCEKLQGFYYNEPVSAEDIVNGFEKGVLAQAEEPEEAVYYDAIGRINLYDLSAAASQDQGTIRHYFNMVPMAIIELDGDRMDFVRTNQSYRDFTMRAVGHDVAGEDKSFSPVEKKSDATYLKLIFQCGQDKSQSFISEKLPDNSTVYSVVRWLADNPRTGASAVLVTILAIVDGEQETTYESIARALAADYFQLYYVDLETDRFIEYRSDVTREELAIERHGEDFFQTMRKNAGIYIYEEDVEGFIFAFTKQNIERALKEQGTFTLTFRRVLDGKPVHVNLKAMRMQSDGKQIIVAMNKIENQAVLEEGYERSVISNVMSGTEAARLGSASLNTVSFAVKSCIRLMETGEFTDNVEAVLEDIMDVAQAGAVRIMLVNASKKELSIFSDAVRDPARSRKGGAIEGLDYEIAAGWEKLTGESNSVIVTSDEEFQWIEQESPEWAASLRGVGIKSIVLTPLRRADRTLGYLYVLNFNTKKTERIRELIELVSYFLSSEIESYLFRKELEILSNYDDLTGLKNRHAMLTWIRKFERSEPERICGVMTMDLNGLKRLNDTEGHFAGDRLIIDTTEMLRKEFGEEFLYRIGGDEFIAIFPDITKEAFDKRIEAFRKSLAKEEEISLAIGPWWSDKTRDMEILFGHADENMYADKKEFYKRHPELKESR